MTKRILILFTASLIMLTVAVSSVAATAFGTAITNTATASYNITGTPVTSGYLETNTYERERTITPRPNRDATCVPD